MGRTGHPWSRVTTALLVVMVAIACAPCVAWALTGYVSRSLNTTTLAVSESTEYTTATSVTSTTTEWSSGWYVVDNDVTIDGRITATGDVHLILADRHTLTASRGITVETGNTLTIHGQTGGTGVLEASGGDYTEGTKFYRVSGIGDYSSAEMNGMGYDSVDFGTVVIEGGVVTVSSNVRCCIGGGDSAGSVTILGGTVTATGRQAIGNATTVTIAGGTVNATSTDDHTAAIGGGFQTSGGTIRIGGGTVNATGGSYAGGIGAGYNGSGGSVTITGGNVKSSKGANATAAISPTPTNGTSSLALRTYASLSDFTSDKYYTSTFTGYRTFEADAIDGSYYFWLPQITTAVLDTAPSAIAGLVYNENDQDLVTAGNATNGTLYYAVVAQGAAEPAASAYSTTVAHQVVAGTYDVWYKVVGNGGYADVPPAKTQATIMIPTSIAVGTTGHTWGTAVVFPEATAVPVNPSAGVVNVTVTSSDPTKLTATLSGSTLTLTPVQGVGDVLGTYTVTVAGDAESAAYAKPASVTYHVNVKPGTFSLQGGGYKLYYTGSPQVLGMMTPAPADATVKYGTAEGTYDLDEAPSQTEPGTYTTYYQVTKDNYSTLSGSFSTTISKATVEPTVTAADLTYTGEPQTLVSVSGAMGTMHWRLGTDGAWSTTVPTATDVANGSYAVYWYMDANDHYEAVASESSPRSIDVTISPASTSLSLGEAAVSTAYPTSVSTTVSLSTGAKDAVAKSSDASKLAANISGGVVIVSPVSGALNVIGTYTVTVSASASSNNYAAPTDVVLQVNVTKGIVTPKRLWGENALDTMKSIVEGGFSGTGGTVVLATGSGYWDALTASGVAGFDGAPLLLTSIDGKSLSSQTRDELARLKPSRIVVCGGTEAVPDALVTDAVAASGSSPATTRLWGENAVATADAIYVGASSNLGHTWATTAFVTTGSGYWDALSIAPYAYARHCPIFLSGENGLSDDTVKAMASGGVKDVFIVGGIDAVPDSVTEQLAAAGITVSGRLAGYDAIDTSRAVADYEIGQGMSADGMAAATTEGFYDALTGAAFCGKHGSVLILVPRDTSGNLATVYGFVTDNRGSIGSAYIFGGTAAVGADVKEAFARALN